MLWNVFLGIGHEVCNRLKSSCLSLLIQNQVCEGGEEILDECTSGITEQASYAVNKLRQLTEKLEYKRQALSSIINAPKPDKKVQTN